MRAPHFFLRKPLSMTVAALTAWGGQAIPLAAAEPLMEEVIVTATRRSESIYDIPYNISAISGKELEAANIVDAADLMRAMPGVAVVDRGYRNSGVINGVMIRGLNTNGAALGDYALSAVPTVSTYVNDTPVYANFLLKDIERVEVLRGPQGTLYGSGSLGGTVRYLMRAPNLEATSVQLATSVSQTDNSSGFNFGADATINIPFSDMAGMRIVAGTVQNDGVTDYRNVYKLDASGVPTAPDGVLSDTAEYENVKDADDADIKYMRASLLLQPTDSFSALLSYHHQEDEIGSRRHQTPGVDGWGVPYRDNESGSVLLEPSDSEFDLASLEMDFDLGFATLTSSSSWYDTSGNSISENTGFYAQNGWLGLYYYNYPRPMAQAVRSYADEAVVQELRLVSNGNNVVDYVIGAFYIDQDRDSTQESLLSGFKNWADVAWGDSTIVASDKDFDYARNENFKEFAVYGEVTYNVTEQLRVTGGARYFDNELTNDTYMAVGLYTSSSSDTASFKAEDDDVLLKFNISYDLNPQQMLYATVSEGYRRGGVNAVPLTGPFAENPAWQTYDRDEVVNYELGIKGATDSLQYTAALFYVDWKDIQVDTATSFWGFYSAINGGDASTQGIEISMDGALTQELRYGFGYTYVDAELEDNVCPPQFGPNNCTTPLASSGNELPGTARNTVNAYLQYSAPVNETGLLWTTRLDGYYQSETENAINNSVRFNETLDSFDLWHVSTSLGNDTWQASLFVRNLFNEEGITGVYKEAYMGGDVAQNYFGSGAKEIITAPRTIGLSARYTF